MKKLIFALIVIAALLVVAMPVAAQGPNPYNPVASWYDRTSQMTAAWAGDPFGGNPRLGIEVKYEPDGKGGVAAKYANASWPYQGIVAKFGLSPWSPQNILPGGIPSSMSGDGSSPLKAIYIGGAWADPKVDPANMHYGGYLGTTAIPVRGGNENPIELPACATVKIPASGTKTFKLDTWKTENQGGRIRTQIWLDDELDGATKPSGSAVFGAANRYFYGTAPGDGWQQYNAYWGENAQDNAEINGYYMGIYDPDVLQPNYAFAPPNAWIFTIGNWSRSCSAAAYAGQQCVPASKGGPSSNNGNSLSWTASLDGLNAGQAIKGFGQFNPNQPSHLLWYEGTWDGWVFARVYNQMIWDGTVTVCSYRNVSP